jgi:Tfp pilus assembly PilM family ATPase
VKTAAALRERIARGRAFLEQRYVEPERPQVAVEVRASSVGVVRVVGEPSALALGAAALVELPAGTVALSMTESNVKDGPAFARALVSALEKAGVLGATRIALVLPDPVARLALFPSAEVSAKKRAQVEELIRFKARKTIPFDIREAQLAYRTGIAEGSDQTLMAAIAKPVLDGYESACHALGLEPGLVELAGPTMLNAAFSGLPTADRLFINWDEGYLSLLLARGAWPLLVRTIVGAPASSTAEVAREVANTILYYRDRLGGTGLSATVLRSAWLPTAEASALLAGPLGAPPAILDGLAGLRGAEAGSAASQVLAGAVASARGTFR